MSIKSTKHYLWAQKVTHKMLFMSTRWAQNMHTDVVYEHRWAQDDAHRCCLLGHKMSTRWAQDVIYEHKKHKKQLFFP